MKEAFVVSWNKQPSTVIIGCKRILICEKTLDIEIDISNSIKKIDKIIVNGMEFIRTEKGGAK